MGELEFCSPEHGLRVEAHWEVREAIGARAISGNGLLARAVPLRLLCREVLAPSPLDSLLIDCVHGSKHWWDSVEKLLGVAIQVRRFPVAEWPLLLAAARDAGCRRRVAVAITHVCRVFGMPVPAEVADAVARDRIGHLLLGTLGPESLDRRLPLTPRRDLVTMARRFICEDTVNATLRHMAIRISRPGEEDWEGVSLPRGLEWLHYVLRPGRLAIKWAKRLVN